MASKASTYRAVLIGLALIIVAVVIYFIYKAVTGTKKVVQSGAINTVLNPTGAGQTIKENAPVSNQGAAGVSSNSIVPVQNNSNTNSGNYNGTYGSGTANDSNSGNGSAPSGYDTANYGPPNGVSPCNSLDKTTDPNCQQQQVIPKN